MEVSPIWGLGAAANSKVSSSGQGEWCLMAQGNPVWKDLRAGSMYEAPKTPPRVSIGDEGHGGSYPLALGQSTLCAELKMSLMLRVTMQVCVQGDL